MNRWRSETISDAILIATEAHRGQVDKQGAPYIFHPLRVMEAVRHFGAPVEVQVAAVLHDVIEDTSLTSPQLKARGVSDAALWLVEMLTRDRSVDYMSYIERIVQARSTPLLMIKLADMTDNIGRSHGVPGLGHLAAKYQRVFQLVAGRLPADSELFDFFPLLRTA